MKLQSYILLTLLCIFIGQLYAQNIKVSSFKLLEGDITANTEGSMYTDQNGYKAALIKVVTLENGYSFDTGSLGIVKIISKPGEIWVYVPRSVRKITISHSKFGILRNYQFPIQIEGARTYEMVLSNAHQNAINSLNSIKDYSQMSVSELERQVEMKDTSAMIQLASYYSTGIHGVDKDPYYSYSLYKKAADAGSAKAICLLGECYRLGKGVLADKAKAVSYYNKSIEMGYSDGYYYIAECYLKGDGVNQDSQKAIDLLSTGTDKGSVKCMVELSLCYSESNYPYSTITSNYDKSFQLSSKAAKNDDALGLLSLSLCYLNGYGVPKDTTKYIQLLQKSAEEGNLTAMYMYGNLFLNGKIIDKDYQAALSWERRAAESGDNRAMFIYGALLTSGDRYGLPVNKEEGKKWTVKAAENGNPIPQEIFATTYFQFKQYDKALYWAKLCGENPNYKNQSVYKILYECYEKGLGTNIDLEKANYWKSKIR